MTRPIKFRAWDKEENRFFDSYANIEYLLSQYPPSMADCPYEYMQFTGLLDKNGKEIYEGDVVKGTVEFPQLLTMDTDENCNFKMAGEVFYDSHKFSLKCIQSMCDPKREGMVNYFDFCGNGCELFSEMEVIGNIYENPSLINE